MNDADALALVAEDWLRRLDRDGSPRPGEQVRGALAAVALGAPRTAARCPHLLRLVGPRVTEQVTKLVAELDASEAAAGAADGARWMTPAEAARNRFACSG